MQKLMLTLTLAAMCVCALAQSAGTPAQTPAGPQTTTIGAPPADPARMKAASDLIQAMNMESTFKESMDTMLRLQIEANPQLQQFEPIMREFMSKYLMWADVREDFVRLYANMFTEPELKELVVFYQTPLGKKMLVAMPELMARSSDITQQRLQPHMPELQQKIMAQLQQQQKQQPGAAPQGTQPGAAPGAQPGAGQGSQPGPAQGSQPGSGQGTPPPANPQPAKP